ncbi:MAG: hypothetical protein IV100_27065 [Myxococcales bacterium]|nr:hypothetical protein [Myxococcales bacterium]
MTRSRSNVVHLVAALVSACSDDAPLYEEDVSAAQVEDVAPAPAPCLTELVDLREVVPLGPDADPFPDRPADFPCAPEGLHFEELGGEPVYSINTGACAYTTAVGSLAAALSAGDTVEARVWHFTLLGPTAEAHVSVRIGDTAVLDERIAIPGESGMSVASFTLDGPVAAGTSVYFHLHNHGSNSWSWLGLRRLSCASEASVR